MASLVPDTTLVHFVLCDFGRLGRAFVETDPARSGREHITEDILSGELDRPLQVIVLRADGTWRDVSIDLAGALLDAARRDSDGLTTGARDFVTEHLERLSCRRDLWKD